MMKKMVMRGRKRSRVPACRLFSGFDDDDEMEEDINIDEDGHDEDGDEKPWPCLSLVKSAMMMLFIVKEEEKEDINDDNEDGNNEKKKP